MPAPASGSDRYGADVASANVSGAWISSAITVTP